MEQIEQPLPESTIVLDHGDTRVIEQVPETPDDGLSELERYKQTRDAKPTEPAPINHQEPSPEVEEPKKPERWKDPDTGDTYDMRHKVARRIKQVLEKHGTEKARADALERRVDELTKTLIDRGATPAKAEAMATAAVEGDPEPDAADLTKYPEGQFDRAFIKDAAKWAARQETQSFAKTQRDQDASRRQAAVEDQAIGRWQQTLPETRARYADFDQVLAKIPTTPENAPIVNLMMGSPVGNDVVYVLGTQPEAMEAYRRAPNHDSRLRLLHHIEAQIISAHRGKTPAPKTPTTSAPPPTEPVHAGAGPSGPIDWSRTDDPDQYARYKATRKTTR